VLIDGDKMLTFERAFFIAAITGLLILMVSFFTGLLDPI
jgi:hypothetical protein